ncbi:MAG: hypothetical protein DMF26_18575 [Verrucomicrobia bacterium]|nr:MAG: hypothetical protein DMF26_18575 [Verrucomicrobiota bacterium]
MNQSKVSTFVFAVASLAGILCVSKTDGQVYGFPPSSPQHRSFPIPSSDSQPISITLGPDGNFWFTEQNRSQVARITPQGVITEFLTPTFSFPIGITAGPDGNIWFSEGAAGSGGQIAFITPDGHIEEICSQALPPQRRVLSLGRTATSGSPSLSRTRFGGSNCLAGT